MISVPKCDARSTATEVFPTAVGPEITMHVFCINELVLIGIY
jgi:hypothetical protein